MTRLKPSRFTLRVIADNTKDISTFAPYVATIDAAGTVYFQATLKDGSSAVLAGNGDEAPSTFLDTVVDTRRTNLRKVVSHPAVSRSGTVAFYAEDDMGERRAYTVHEGRLQCMATEDGPLQNVGPLGPTMNEAGWVAFRADGPAGEHRVCLAASGRVRTIADSGAFFAAFHGLPLVTGEGTVVFRADLRDGTQAIYASHEGTLRLVADTRGRLRSLGRFPSANQAGTVVFTAEIEDGTTGIFAAEIDGRLALVHSGPPNGTLRGALVDGRGRVIFYGSTEAGSLGIFHGDASGSPALLALGDSLLGRTVVDFALNPVSVNESGHLALRVSLTGGLELVLRATRHD